MVIAQSDVVIAARQQTQQSTSMQLVGRALHVAAIATFVSYSNYTLHGTTLLGKVACSTTQCCLQLITLAVPKLSATTTQLLSQQQSQCSQLHTSKQPVGPIFPVAAIGRLPPSEPVYKLQEKPCLVRLGTYCTL